ncbi:stage III sporulation protein AB [Ruminiclostridium sufflavum DSM 19573]|uniref:Stage III sporulation protein AB n=1 Tax=Ruminiclostridium sufflavum DSM 19573 TaxID=1121337 RepID=A0A318XHX4_9FIRM|nr:stage III sporulation protein SpoIIIAB [Ruminiclostridium sufflavum]PYG86810.1 stage III sporulation protein AB [Ruminiclostridium sufflavum DSM 19573]
MIIKILGAVILIGATSFIGFFLASECSKRPRALRELQSLLQMLENEISYLSNILAEAFNRIYENTDFDTAVLFGEAARHLGSDGCTADFAWETAVEENYGRLSLNGEDRNILLSFGKMLGNSDLEGQLNNIRMISSQLKVQEIKAEEIKKKNEKMYRSLGVLSGLAIAIILL